MRLIKEKMCLTNYIRKTNINMLKIVRVERISLKCRMLQHISHDLWQTIYILKQSMAVGNTDVILTVSKTWHINFAFTVFVFTSKYLTNSFFTVKIDF